MTPVLSRLVLDTYVYPRYSNTGTCNSRVRGIGVCRLLSLSLALASKTSQSIISCLQAYGDRFMALSSEMA